MGYFEQIFKRVDEIERQARIYLDSLSFKSTHWVCYALWYLANRRFEAVGGDWDKLEDWEASTVDLGWPPGGFPPRPGSLFHTLAFCPVANDAHLRHRLEVVMGRAEGELPFPVYAEKPEVPEELPPKRRRAKVRRNGE